MMPAFKPQVTHSSSPNSPAFDMYVCMYNNCTTATKDPGQTTFSFKIGLGQVIKGWDEGVMDMSQGEIAKLKCTPDYAYGSGGFPAWGIMPNSELHFEIELLEFK